MILASFSSAIEPSFELPLALRPGDQTASEATPGTIAQYAAADAALAGNADAEGEVAGAVIVAAGQHHGADAPRPLGRHHRVPGRRIPAAIGEEAAGQRQLPAAHGDGAMVEIDAQRQFRRVVEIAEGFHVVGQREIAIAGGAFGGGDLAVDDDGLVVGEELDEAQDLADRLARLVAGEQDVGDDDGAGIDERIARNAVLVLELDDRVERIARWLAPDPLPQRVADLAERQRQGEHLGNALDRKGLVGVAGHQHAPVIGDDGDAEFLRIDLAELRNIGGDVAAIGRARPFRRRCRQAPARVPACRPRYFSQRSMRAIASTMSSWLPA